MSTIGGISGSSNLGYLQPATNVVQSTGGRDSDGDGGGARRIGGGSNFVQSILQVLGQSINGGTSASTGATTSSSPASTASTSGSPQDILASLQAFMQSLFSALHQQNGNAGASTGGADADGDNDGSGSVSGAGQAGGRGQMAAKIQNLLQQLSNNNQGALTSTTGGATDPLSNLNTSFQNLISALGGSGSQSSSAATLQSFLQNLQQDMGNGQNISGAVVNTTA